MKIEFMNPGDRGWWRFRTPKGYSYSLLQCNHRTDGRTKYASTSLLHLDHELEFCAGTVIELTHPALDEEADVVSLDHVNPLLAVGTVINTYSHSQSSLGGNSEITAIIEQLEYRDDIPWAKLSFLDGQLQEDDPLTGWLDSFTIPDSDPYIGRDLVNSAGERYRIEESAVRPTPVLGNQELHYHITGEGLRGECWISTTHVRGWVRAGVIRLESAVSPVLPVKD